MSIDSPLHSIIVMGKGESILFCWGTHGPWPCQSALVIGIGRISLAVYCSLTKILPRFFDFDVERNQEERIPKELADIRRCKEGTSIQYE